MLVEQRHVTNIGLVDGKHRDVYLMRDGRGYKLCLVTKDEVVNIFLSVQDCQKLRQQMLNDRPEAVKDYVFTSEPAEFICHSAEPYVVRWSTLDWLAYN
jgi:hypothetical protein